MKRNRLVCHVVEIFRFLRISCNRWPSKQMSGSQLFQMQTVLDDGHDREDILRFSSSPNWRFRIRHQLLLLQWIMQCYCDNRFDRSIPDFMHAVVLLMTGLWQLMKSQFEALMVYIVACLSIDSCSWDCLLMSDPMQPITFKTEVWLATVTNADVLNDAMIFWDSQAGEQKVSHSAPAASASVNNAVLFWTFHWSKNPGKKRITKI